MKPTRTTTDSLIRHRRIGRKVLQADRLTHALNANRHKKAKYNILPFSSMRPKTIAMICFIIVGVSALGFGGTQFYIAQVDKTQKAAAIEQQAKSKAKSIAAEACRRKKVEQKADQLGKITYDELYDYDECDK